jgi:hypothetical protein
MNSSLDPRQMAPLIAELRGEYQPGTVLEDQLLLMVAASTLRLQRAENDWRKSAEHFLKVRAARLGQGIHIVARKGLTS